MPSGGVSLSFRVIHTMTDVWLTPGMLVRAEWYDGKVVPLAGVQMQMGATRRVVTGRVTPIYGHHPTDPIEIEVHIQADGG